MRLINPAATLATSEIGEQDDEDPEQAGPRRPPLATPATPPKPTAAAINATTRKTMA